MRTEPTAANGSELPSRFPLRLPAGWEVLGQLAGYLVACSLVACPASGRPRPTLCYAAAPTAAAHSLHHLAEALRAELPHRYQDLLVLDVGPVTCRGGRPGVRVLTTHTCAGRSLTTEHWFVDGSGDQVHVLAAVVPTARYAELAAVLHRALRSFREPA